MFKVLLVDDERIIREGIASLIDWEGNGFIFKGAAKNGIEARNMVDEDPPHIIITDLKMPVLDGLGLIALENRLHPDIVFIVLSGYGEFELANQAMRYGVKHYLLKPCNENKIIEVLESVKEELIQKQRKEEFIKRKAYKDVQECLKYSFYLREGSIITKKDIEHDSENRINDTPGYDFEKFAIAVKSGNMDDMDREIEEFFTALQSYNCEIDVAKTYCMELFLSAIRQCRKEDIQQHWLRIAELQGMNCLEKMRDFIRETSIDLTKANYDGIVNRQSRLVRTMIKHIYENIENEEFTLKWLANKILFMNVGYIGKVFSKETNEKFSHYVMTVRMERAKELIEACEIDKVYEVAQKVGLGENPQYFSQVFKKYTGCTPSEYKSTKMSAALDRMKLY